MRRRRTFEQKESMIKSELDIESNQNNSFTRRQQRDHIPCRPISHVLETVSKPSEDSFAIPVSFFSKNPAQATVKTANDTRIANSVAC